MNDQRLIDLLRSGAQSRAIAELYRHFPKVRSLILSHGGSQEDARDVFQEGLLILCKKAAQPDFRLTCSAGTYLYSVCRFLWKDELIKRKREVALQGAEERLPDLSDDIFAVQQQEKEMRHLDRVLNQLGEKCMKLLKMFYFERLDMKRIAKAFGFSSDKSAKTQKYKCLERAKKIAAKSQSIVHLQN